jgi:cysteine desulfurase
VAPRVYLDNSATTPLDPRVRRAMEPYLEGLCGNPSSLHSEGRTAREAVETARARTAQLLGAAPGEIVFTASGTEADNLALVGVTAHTGLGDCHIIVSAIEHPAVLVTCAHLERRGIAVTRVAPDHEGRVHPDAVAAALRPNTRLVSVMAANNVVGTLQPIDEIAQRVHRAGVLFHTDAVQAFGKVPIDVRRTPIDLLSLSAHKLHGPKGVGALYVRAGVALAPLIHGGGQERGLRSATENVAGLVGLGQAALIAREEMTDDGQRLARLCDRIIETTTRALPQAYLIGPRWQRLPGHVCLGFAGYEGEAIRLLLKLDEAGIAASTGSACSAHKASEPSSVLLAMGFDALRARGSLRLTLGRFNTAEDVDRLLETLPAVLSQMRPLGRRTA